MRPLKSYVKTNPEKLDAVTTSVTLEKRHLEFIRRLNLNLSRMVRDYIDQIIKETNSNDKK